VGEWKYSSTILDLSARSRWVVSFTQQLLYPQGKSPWYPFGRRLGGSQSWPRCCGEEDSCPCHELNPGHPACSLLLYRLSYPELFIHCWCNTVLMMHVFKSPLGFSNAKNIALSRPSLHIIRIVLCCMSWWYLCVEHIMATDVILACGVLIIRSTFIAVGLHIVI
jgi:hypothetical protein